MTNYTKGRRLEYLARKELESEGWAVLRSAGSRGAFDLIAVNAEMVRFIQVKMAGALRKAEVRSLRKVKVPDNCTVEVWERINFRPARWRIHELG